MTKVGSVQSVSGSDGWVVSVTTSAARLRSEETFTEIKLGAQGQRGRHFAAHTSASTLLRAYEVRRALCLRYPLLRRFLKTYAWYVDAENVTKHKVSSYPLFLHPAPINNLSINTRPGSPVLALLNKNAGISY